MHEVRLHPSRGTTRDVRVAPGTLLADAVEAAGLPLARGCRGQGLCGRCALWVRDGAGRLSPELADETRAKRRNRVDGGQRLACRARVQGRVEAAAAYW